MPKSNSGKRKKVQTMPTMETQSSQRGDKKGNNKREIDGLNPVNPSGKKPKGSKANNKDNKAQKLILDVRESTDEEEKEEEEEENYETEGSDSEPIESGDDDEDSEGSEQRQEREIEEALERQRKLEEIRRKRKEADEVKKLRKEQERRRIQAEKEKMNRRGAGLQQENTPPRPTDPNESPTNAQSHDEESEDDFQPRGLSNTQAVLKAESHVKQRIIPYIKSVIFRKIKFITSEKMFSKAFRYVLKLEKITDPNKCFRFQTTYESCFNRALNTKRSSCEQAAGKLVRKTMADMKKDGVDFYTMDELCKLRRAVTDRETEAFHWFMSIFLGCICGAKTWTNAQTSMLVSEAKDVSGYKIVTKSDEAFGLLLIENYMEKWKKMLDDEDNVESEAPNQIRAEEGVLTTDSRRNKPTRKRITGKYTAKKSGTTCRYGGWSVEGMARFNELYEMIKADRACQQAAVMEKTVLFKCKERAGIRRSDGNGMQQDGHEAGGDTAMEFMPVEAAWESDDD